MKTRGNMTKEIKRNLKLEYGKLPLEQRLDFVNCGRAIIQEAKALEAQGRLNRENILDNLVNMDDKTYLDKYKIRFGYVGRDLVLTKKTITEHKELLKNIVNKVIN